MATSSDIPHCTKSTQERIFRIAQRNGLTLKAISLDSGIHYSTLRGYAGNNGETAEMPVSALYKLSDVIPDELLSLLLPEGRAIVRVPEGVDFDKLADEFAEFLKTKNEFHRPESECGPALGPHEQDILADKVAHLSIARAVT